MIRVVAFQSHTDNSLHVVLIFTSLALKLTMQHRKKVRNLTLFGAQQRVDAKHFLASEISTMIMLLDSFYASGKPAG